MRRKCSAQGVALIMIVAILMVLSTIGVVFIRTTSIEYNVAMNYGNKIQSRLASWAGVEDAICRLSDYLENHSHISTHNQAWAYPYGPEMDASSGIDVPLEDAYMQHDASDTIAGVSYRYDPSDEANPTPPVAHAPFNTTGYPRYYPSGIVTPLGTPGVMSTAVGNPYLYSLKILDEQGQINVNSHLVIPYNAARQDSSDTTLRRILTQLAISCGFTAAEATTVAQRMLQGENYPGAGTWHQHKAGGWPTDETGILPRRWSTKEKMQEALLRDLGLSWGDTKTRKFWNNVSVSSWIDRSTSVVADPFPAAPHAIPEYYRELRAPVNVNAATKEVLMAVLMIQAQPIYLRNTPGAGSKSSDSSDGNTEVKEDKDVTCVPTRRKLDGTPGLIKLDQATASGTYAELIADRIIGQRKTAGPFRSFGEFANFVDTYLDRTYFPPKFWVTGSGDDEYNPPGGYQCNGVNGYSNADADPKKHDLGNIVWLQACRDLLKSNFNPNTIDNKYNPSRYARFRTVKSDFFDDVGNIRTHSTEFCYSSYGRFDITSLGYGINPRTYEQVSSVLTRTELSLQDIVRHTTQRDFEQGGDFGSNTTTSYPFVVGKNLSHVDASAPDIYTGRVEPHITQTSTSGTTYASQFAPRRGTTPSLPASNSERYSNPAGLTLQNMQIKGMREDPSDNKNNLANDGIVSDRVQYSSANQVRFHSIGALHNGTEGARRGMNFPGQTYRGDSSAPRSSPGANDRMPYYKGALEFWVKLTEPSNSQIPAGLFSSTQVNLHPATDPDPYPSENDTFAWEYQLTNKERSEGVQFYIFKNTYGQLRFSRIYFCVTYSAGGALKGTHYLQDADAWNYLDSSWPVHNRWKPQASQYHYYFPIPRRDIVIKADNLKWEANTWHHVYIAWDDGGGNHASHIHKEYQKIYIDGSDKDTQSQHLNNSDQINDPEFCILNEKDPRDCMNVCGFFRPQFEPDDGIFKLPDSQVYFPGNATISNVRIYSLPEATPLSSLVSAPVRRAFEISSTYQNTMVVPHGGFLATLSWTVYPDNPGASAGSAPSSEPYVMVSASYTDINGVAQSASAYEGRGCEIKGSVWPNASVSYSVDFRSSFNECSSLDDVTLSINRVSISNYIEYD